MGVGVRTYHQSTVYTIYRESLNIILTRVHEFLFFRLEYILHFRHVHRRGPAAPPPGRPLPPERGRLQPRVPPQEGEEAHGAVRGAVRLRLQVPARILEEEGRRKSVETSRC